MLFKLLIKNEKGKKLIKNTPLFNVLNKQMEIHLEMEIMVIRKVICVLKELSTSILYISKPKIKYCCQGI